MGAKDTATIKYMRQNEIFADAFNYFGEKQPVQRTRDVIKAVTTKTDNRIAYVVVAIEAQSNIHYAMPVKNVVCLNYFQVEI